MSETYTPAGTVGSSLQRATAGEAATGTHGQEFMRDDMTKIADKIRFLADDGTLTSSKHQFPATQVPSADPNALDDYEEGTFTPGITFGGLSTGIVYSAQIGRYTKVGNRVFFTIFVGLTSKGSAVGATLVTGLPFVSNAIGYATPRMRVDTMAAGVTIPPQGYVNVATTNVFVEKLSAGSSIAVPDTDFTNISSIMVSGHYEV